MRGAILWMRESDIGATPCCGWRAGGERKLFAVAKQSGWTSVGGWVMHGSHPGDGQILSYPRNPPANLKDSRFAQRDISDEPCATSNERWAMGTSADGGRFSYTEEVAGSGPVPRMKKPAQGGFSFQISQPSSTTGPVSKAQVNNRKIKGSNPLPAAYVDSKGCLSILADRFFNLKWHPMISQQVGIMGSQAD
jgi:hypothetical protein